MISGSQGGLVGGVTGGQKRQLDAVGGLLGGATGTDSAAGASSSGSAGSGPLDAVVSDAPAIVSPRRMGRGLEIRTCTDFRPQGGVVDGVTDTAGSVVGGATDAVGGVVNGVGSTVGNTVGGVVGGGE